ncbi:MAG: long-chain fatty acid--CoA ligase [Micromonosporaceae bacterium]
MRSTMHDVPLLVSRILEHGSTVHGERSEVRTWTGDGVRRMTYAEVGRRAAQLAHGLRDELGVTGDQRVGTLCWNNNEHLISYLAVPSMGAVLHPLNLRLPPAQLAYVANHAEDKVIVVDNTLVPLLAAVLPQLTTVEHVVVVGQADTAPLATADKPVYLWDELLAGRPESYDWPDLHETDAASLCYTSGTTGNPKGVAYSHRSIYLHSMQVCMAESFDLGAGDSTLAVVPMFHAGAWGLPYASLMSGGSLLMPDRFLQAAPLAAMIAAERPSFAGAVPTIWADLLRHLDENPTDTSSLKNVVVGGSACPPALMEAYDRHGINVIHAWGMTETSPLGSVARPPAGLDEDATWRYRLTQGRVPASVQARIIGPDGQPAATDGEAVGELEVRGPWITGTYIGDAEPDPEKFDDGWLRTGDVGTLSSDGFLTLTDRAKDVIKSGGEWISSVELENHLMAHPAVTEAAVIAVPDDRWDERPLAAVVLAEGETVGAEQLREFLADKVAKWQLPERWSFVNEVPKTSVGKFDKKVLRARYAEGGLDVSVVG